MVSGALHPAVYPEVFAAPHYGEPEDEILRYVHSGPGRDRQPVAGNHEVSAASGSKGANKMKNLLIFKGSWKILF